jgi:hypothetical protein
MVYRKGELSASGIDRDWPHQVALAESQVTGWRHEIVHAFCKELSLCPRGHAVYDQNQWWYVFCFAQKADAKKFLQRFGGQRFDPKQRGKGADWARWRK